ncbi:hypothetical protein BA768_12895 [Chryseobacterium sp. CBo1]|uniref:SIR2 family protein n=1 Tax=Chryseobacterium sp. CBo1 TaxID=1869230 RepID=UPI0008109D9C|nr:SIR2 family protein [Chryseobacterium sp. CBo1]OCK52244.1 hypothetical protein BA768_12895 [Chryseobacterium sp. CBo1]
MEKHLTVILGAGFSANAGMPTASEIAKRFNRDLKEKILSASSSEWFWIDDKDENFIHNGKLNFDYLAYSYVFDELVKKYVLDMGTFIYYEDFYQYIIDNFKNSDWVENLFETAKKSFLTDRPFLLEEKNKEYYKSYVFAFDHKQFSKVSAILNYLIGDILSIIPRQDDELINIYQGFTNYIRSFDEVDIFTLNHDILLEHLLEINKINYSKGFNTENSPIMHNNKPVPYFNNEFKEKIRIHKLHGSLDFYQFRHYNKEGIFSKPTEKVDYYMATNFYVKHNSQLINPETNELLQDYNFDIVPKFITGTRKTDTIKNDILYNKLFKNFENTIANSDNLFVSGYSFSDDHLNEKIKEKEFNFINHNRSKDYPFLGTGKNIRSFDDL